MQDFLIFYAPPLLVVLAIMLIFWWGARPETSENRLPKGQE
ncbi:cytochrome bd oxidase small subunit CydS [Paenibacillus swuensis]|nr:hypothetical protein [Paenibacillus swuensis]